MARDLSKAPSTVIHGAKADIISQRCAGLGEPLVSARMGLCYSLDDVELTLNPEIFPIGNVTIEMALESGVGCPKAYLLLSDLRGSCGLQEQSGADMALASRSNRLVDSRGELLPYSNLEGKYFLKSSLS